MLNDAAHGDNLTSFLCNAAGKILLLTQSLGEESGNYFS